MRPERFSAEQTTTIQLQGSWAQVQDFLSEPKHLTAALLDQGQVRQLTRERFEVRMRPIGALGVQIQPVVQLQIQTLGDGQVTLQAIGCRIEGNEWIDQHFSLTFTGQLSPLEIRRHTSSPQVILRGTAQLQVSLVLPPVLALTPRPLVETVGSTIVQGVLMTIRLSLSCRLPQSFLAYRQAHLLPPSFPNSRDTGRSAFPPLPQSS